MKLKHKLLMLVFDLCPMFGIYPCPRETAIPKYVKGMAVVKTLVHLGRPAIARTCQMNFRGLPELLFVDRSQAAMFSITSVVLVRNIPTRR